MRKNLLTREREAGVTLVELLVVMAILGIMAGVAIPTFAVWFPNYRLRSAATDLFSNMQRAKLGAIKGNTSWGIAFSDGATTDTYTIWSYGPDRTWGTGDDDSINTLDLIRYEGDAYYGWGDATKNMSNQAFGGAGDRISYQNDRAVFNLRGLGSGGYVYLQNGKGTAYAVGTTGAGVIRLRKWSGSAWQ